MKRRRKTKIASFVYVSMDRLRPVNVYAAWAVVNGLAFFVSGWLSWGRYYFVGLGHFLVAALMPLRLDLAPLVYGVFTAGCMAWGAWDLHRVGRRTKPLSEAKGTHR